MPPVSPVLQTCHPRGATDRMACSIQHLASTYRLGTTLLLATGMAAFSGLLHAQNTRASPATPAAPTVSMPDVSIAPLSAAPVSTGSGIIETRSLLFTPEEIERL